MRAGGVSCAGHEDLISGGIEKVTNLQGGGAEGRLTKVTNLQGRGGDGSAKVRVNKMLRDNRLRGWESGFSANSGDVYTDG
jgi:hypothetical protein